METILRKELLQKKLMKLKTCSYIPSTSYRLSPRKVHHCRFENLDIISCLFNTLKISHSYSTELTSYLRVQFTLFLTSILLLNIFYCWGWTFCSLLVTRYFLLVARCSLLFARYFLLIAFCSLLVIFYSLLVIFSSNLL